MRNWVRTFNYSRNPLGEIEMTKKLRALFTRLDKARTEKTSAKIRRLIIKEALGKKK